jgi:hypothetical protein
MKVLYFTLILCAVISCNKKDVEVPETVEPFMNFTMRPPDSSRLVILVKLDGDTTNTTSWGDLKYAGVKMKNADKQKIVQGIYDAFAEFRAVTVTTDETIFNQYKKNKRVIAAITNSIVSSTGDVALLNSITFDDDSPCFIRLVSTNEPEVTVLIAVHEIGHTLGLVHQSDYDPSTCRMTREYSRGTNGIVPFMGDVGFGTTWVWRKGPCVTGCGVIQDDFTIIREKIVD